MANAIRALSIDAIDKAKSGHPGMPLGMSDIAQVLWNDYLRHNPKNPEWINRDRFILSNGHGSMLLYSLLHLTGYNLNLEEIKNFRQLHSKTPGHPEYRLTPGIECTTGPLGQGAAMSVGMAIGQKHLEASLDQDLFSNFTWVVLGDGCMQEGVTLGAASLAGRATPRDRPTMAAVLAAGGAPDRVRCARSLLRELLERRGHCRQGRGHPPRRQAAT